MYMYRDDCTTKIINHSYFGCLKSTLALEYYVYCFMIHNIRAKAVTGGRKEEDVLLRSNDSEEKVYEFMFRNLSACNLSTTTTNICWTQRYAWMYGFIKTRNYPNLNVCICIIHAYKYTHCRLKIFALQQIYMNVIISSVHSHVLHTTV